MSSAPVSDSRAWWQKPAFYLGLFVVAALIGVWVLGLAGNLATTPTTYSEDGIAASVGTKGIIDNGQPYTNRFLSAPDGAQYFDFPSADASLVLITWLITRFTKDYVLALNLFALLTYPLVALAAAWAMRRLRISAPVAFVFALLYALLPFHQTRVMLHLFLSAYFVVPLAIALIADVVLRSADTPRVGRTVLGLPPWGWGVVLLMGTSGIYYAYFALVLVTLAGILSWYRNRSWRSALPAVSIVVVVVGLLALQMLPSYLYWNAEGRNNTGDLRQPAEADYFGLRLTQLVYPMDGHRIERFAGAKEFLHASLEMVSPNMAFIAYDSSLGIVGVLGFVLLGFWMIAAPFRAPPEGADGVPGRLAFVGVSSFLLGTVGGVGALIAFLAFPQIRAYDRITVYVAFASLSATAWFADRAIERFDGQRHGVGRQVWVPLLLAAVLAVGIYDQTNPQVVGPDYDTIRDAFASDEAFVGDIQRALPEDAAVFQLPFVPYAEAATEGDIGTYEALRLYLHSDTIRWSAGAFNGRPTATWQAKTAELAPVEMLAELADAGFAGVTVDREGYDDDGTRIERELSAALGGQLPEESPDGRYAFFVLD